VSRTGTELRPRNLARLCPSARLAGHAESISRRENRTGLSHLLLSFSVLVIAQVNRSLDPSINRAHVTPSEAARAWSYERRLARSPGRTGLRTWSPHSGTRFWSTALLQHARLKSPPIGMVARSSAAFNDGRTRAVLQIVTRMHAPRPVIHHAFRPRYTVIASTSWCCACHSPPASHACAV
jgi:hypothetical protein